MDNQDGDNKGRAKGDLALRALCGAAALVVVIGGLRIAAPLITQFLMIAFIAIIVSPLYYLMRRWRFPHWLSVTLLLLLMAVVLAFAATSLLPGAVMEFSGNIKGYGSRLRDVSDSIQAELARRNLAIPDKAIDELVGLATKFLGTIGGKSLSFIGNFSTNTVITLIIVAFIFGELNSMPDRVRKLSWMTPARWKLVTGFVADVRHYMGIKAVASAITALVIYGGLLLIGVDSAGMLGIIAFFFNFVPVVGSLLATVPGVLLALAGQGFAGAAWTLVLYLVVNQGVGNIIEPRIMGKGFGVSSVVVLVSVIFWGWMLGPIGMLFAVPLTMAVRSAIETQGD